MRIYTPKKRFNKAVEIKIGKSSIIKKLNKSFKPGTKQGGFPSMVKYQKNTWYHIFMAGKHVVPTYEFFDSLYNHENIFGVYDLDIGFDYLVSGDNLLIDAKKEGFRHIRRIGSVLTNNYKNIVPFYSGSGVFIQTKGYPELFKEEINNGPA